MLKDDLSSLIDVASGRVPCDILFTDLQLVDVLTGSIVPAEIAVYDGLIAGIITMPDPSRTFRYAARKQISLDNAYVVPGFIDAHMHIESSQVTPDNYARIAILHGTTTAVADAHEIANVSGADGLRYMMYKAKTSPLDFKFMLPSCVPALPQEQAGASLGAAELSQILDELDFYGIGEFMDFPSIISAGSEAVKKLELALRTSSQKIDGHAPLVRDFDLNAYAASGIFADHECTNPEEALDKITRGMYVMMREGSCSHDVQALSQLLFDHPRALSRVCLCTDDRSPKDAVSHGFIDNAIRILIEQGIDPLDAITMATINAATALGFNTASGFSEKRGALAPGYRADMLVYRDLSFTRPPEQVYLKGKPYVQDYELYEEGFSSFFEQHKNPELERDILDLEERLRRSMKLPVLDRECFEFSARPSELALGLKLRSVLTTAEEISQEMIDNRELLHLVLVERHGRALGLQKDEAAPIEKLLNKHIGRCFAIGYPLKGASIASSVGHDSHNVLVIGDSSEDMLLAYKELGFGGFTLVSQGRLLAKIDLPLAGLLSEKTVEELAQEEAVFMQELCALGYPLEEGLDPLMPLIFASLPVIPRLRITPQGIFDVQTFTLLDR